ncbi:MAG: thioredoxin domain-containing protein [Candidatus Brocadia sp.]|nr:MAG: thioredoxin domain-containing protein [Candidatus Brocadia sp.]
MKSNKIQGRKPAGFHQRRASSFQGKVLLALFLLTFLGLAVSVVIIRLHFQIGINPESNTFCHLSDLFDCESFLTSRYARLGPIFAAEFGFGFYTLFLCGLLGAWGAKKPLSVYSFLFIGTVLFFTYSVIQNLISFFALGTLCYPCLVIPTVNLAILILMPIKMKTSLYELPIAIKNSLHLNWKSLLIPGVGAVLIFGLGLLMARRLNTNARYSLGISPEESIEQFYSAPPKNVLIPDRTVLGDPNARTTIIAFSDFQCPTCRQAESVLAKVLEKYKGRIRLIYLNYPLNPDCNPGIGRTKHHLMACISAKEILCAYQYGKFSQYHEWAVKNQVRFQSPPVLAEVLSIDRVSFDKCLESEKTASLLKEDIETARHFEVRKFPSIFINGRLFSDWQDEVAFRQVVESELASNEIR